MIEVYQGSIFNAKCDLLIIPCDNMGGISTSVWNGIKTNDVPRLNRTMEVGEVVFIQNNGKFPNASMIGYAASVDARTRTSSESVLHNILGQFTRNYTQTVKRAADNKRRYAPGWVHSTCLLRGFPKGAAPHLAHDFAEQSVVCYTLCRRCPENTVAAGEGKGI